jgi:hypothetical protein
VKFVVLRHFFHRAVRLAYTWKKKKCFERTTRRVKIILSVVVVILKSNKRHKNYTSGSAQFGVNVTFEILVYFKEH